MSSSFVFGCCESSGCRNVVRKGELCLRHQYERMFYMNTQDHLHEFCWCGKIFFEPMYCDDHCRTPLCLNSTDGISLHCSVHKSKGHTSDPKIDNFKVWNESENRYEIDNAYFEECLLGDPFENEEYKEILKRLAKKWDNEDDYDFSNSIESVIEQKFGNVFRSRRSFKLRPQRKSRKSRRQTRIVC